MLIVLFSVFDFVLDEVYVVMLFEGVRVMLSFAARL